MKRIISILLALVLSLAAVSMAVYGIRKRRAS